jgi:hypothetical protein
MDVAQSGYIGDVHTTCGNTFHARCAPLFDKEDSRDFTNGGTHRCPNGMDLDLAHGHDRAADDLAPTEHSIGVIRLLQAIPPGNRS